MKTKTEISAGGIVFKREKEKIFWLICQHSYHKGWVFPKGLVGDNNPKEKMEEAALREVEEEGGVKARIISNKPVKVSYNYKWQGSPHAGKNEEKILVKKKVYYFLMEYLDGDPKNHDWEISDAKFALEEEVKKTLTYKSDREAFEKVLEIFKNYFSQ